MTGERCCIVVVKDAIAVAMADRSQQQGCDLVVDFTVTVYAHLFQQHTLD